jgi:nucleotide-binding universal stress UspA family protein
MIRPIRTILAGISNIEGEDPLLVPALELARQTGASLHFLHVFEPGLETVEEGSDVLEERTEAVRSRLMAMVAPHLQDEWVQCWAVAGAPAPTLREAAKRKGADLILIGATSEPAASASAMGSTARQLVDRGAVPVLLARHAVANNAERVVPAFIEPALERLTA